MQLISPGDTGFSTTPIGLGMAAIGRPGYINIGHGRDLGEDVSQDKMEQNAHHVLDAAWENGIRYFDAARSYGMAEYFLSTWIASRNIKSDEITVASKWGYVYTSDWSIHAEKHEVKMHNVDNFHKQWKESKELLGDYIDLYQIHSATLDSGVLTNAEVLTALSDLKSNGIKIGLSLSGPKQATTLYKAMDVWIDGQPLFDSVQATWNLMETSVTEAFIEASDRGMAIIVKEALANGRLINPSNNGQYDLGKLLAISEKVDCSPDALALAVAVSKPYIDIVLSGASIPEHLISNVKALQVDLSLFHQDELNYLKQDAMSYWRDRSSLAWN